MRDGSNLRLLYLLGLSKWLSVLGLSDDDQFQGICNRPLKRPSALFE